MGRHRLPALVALVAGLLLGAGVGAQGVAASGATTVRDSHAAHAVEAIGASVRSAGTEAFVPTAGRSGNAAFRAGHHSPGAVSLRQIAVFTALAALTAALGAFLIRQRPRSRPPGRHRSTLLARGPPLLLAR